MVVFISSQLMGTYITGMICASASLPSIALTFIAAMIGMIASELGFIYLRNAAYKRKGYGVERAKIKAYFYDFI